MKKFIFTLFLALLLGTTSLTATVAQSLRFGTEATYPPFEFTDTSNAIVGFDIDITNALCAEMQITCTFINQDFNSLIPSLKMGRINAVISALDITPERRRQVAFTQPYYSNSAQFIINKVVSKKEIDKNEKILPAVITELSTLHSKRVGIQNGTTHQKFLLEKHPDIISVAYDSYQNAILDLKNGRLQAVFGDTEVIKMWLKNDNTLEALGDKITDSAYFGSGIGIAVNQGNDELLQKLNLALIAITESGAYQAIHNKWFL